MSRRKSLAVVAVLLASMSPLALSGCTDDELLARDVTINVAVQETTLEVTASWTYSDIFQSTWEMMDEWYTQRQSGGDNWFHSGATPDRTVTFTVPRSVNTDAVGEFCVTPVRVSPQPATGIEECVTFNVPSQALPPPAIDSLTIEVARLDGSGLMAIDGLYITYDTSDPVPAGDTLWRYHALSGPDTLLLSAQMASQHSGLQLYAVLWVDDERAYCSLEPCFGIPPIPEDVGALPAPHEIRMALAPRP